MPTNTLSDRGCYAGAGVANITPGRPTFLYGYPHVPRISSGVHDPLLASALYLSSGVADVLFVQADVIWLSKAQVAEARNRIAERTGLSVTNVVLTASHTHSGPVTQAMLSNIDDPVVPPPDLDYVDQLLAGIVDAGSRAHANAEAAEIAFTSAECSGIGSNRLCPQGSTITQVPIVAARAAADNKRWLGLMFINPVHPTVLQQYSTLVSGDFPSLCRSTLQARLLGADCPVLCHLGAAGNQSPRHVVRVRTFDEARRLGDLLATAVEQAIVAASFSRRLSLQVHSTEVTLPRRELPEFSEAMSAVHHARCRLNSLRTSQADTGLVRTAECAVFGAEETLSLVRAADSGKLKEVQDACLPAEIQLIDFGEHKFVCWPGEVFAEFAIELRHAFPNASVITLANGELQGYLVTAEAVEQRCYEAGNAVFASPEAGTQLLTVTMELLSDVSCRV